MELLAALEPLCSMLQPAAPRFLPALAWLSLHRSRQMLGKSSTASLKR